MVMAVPVGITKEQLMRTNAVLNATELAKPSYRNPVPATLGEPEPTYGCNCDRWGHPCPGGVERNLQPRAELPISYPAEESR